jgi:Na+-transporting NADH:ubiquinone oxidoreductase subunit C
VARPESTRYTLLFATTVCVVCALLVSVAAVSLQPRQAAAARLYMEKNVLLAAGLIEPGTDVSEQEVSRIFAERIRVRLVDLATGELVPADRMDARAYDQRKARGDPAMSRVAPPNNAGIGRLPNYGIVYFIMKDGPAGKDKVVDQIVIAVEGLGMWGTIYGFLSLDRDTNTVRGLTYYDQKETPGLGGEIGNPKWQALWRGRRGFDDQWNARITVIKGEAGAPDADPLRVDGLSGATVTSNAITRLMQFWLSDNGYGKFLRRFREGQEA